jgi:UDP-glucose 4-epimerase
MKKIVVTGGAGFIGSHTVVELHQAGYTPILIDDFSNSDNRIVDGLSEILGYSPVLYRQDVTNTQALLEIFTKEKPDGVIHFAAFKAVGESVANPLKYYRNNLAGLLSVLEVMKECDIRSFVFSSSCTVYGQPDHNPVTEESPFLFAESPYGASKQMSERIITDVQVSAPHFSAVILRYFNPIGAHESAAIGELPFGVPSNLVPYITQTAAGWHPLLSVFGSDYNTPDGSCIRDFIHVVDLAKAHVKALRFIEEHPHCLEVFNLGQGKGHSVLEVVKTFEKISGQKLPYEIGERRNGDVEKIWSDTHRSKEMLHWETQKTLEDALRDAWRWQQKLEAKS